MTWTKLAATAIAGSSTIQLVDPVEWNKDDEIVIAATGHHHSQSENEKKTITAISEDKMTLTLDFPLEASHLGVEETFDGTLVEMRGEVGLLTHNVVVRGNRDPQWTEFIEKCPAGFNTGMVQKYKPCFTILHICWYMSADQKFVLLFRFYESDW